MTGAKPTGDSYVAAKKVAQRAETYTHEEEALLRPDVGTQAQLKKKKPPKTYHYDSSLSPALDWDGQNSSRELGEWLLVQVHSSVGNRQRWRTETQGTRSVTGRRCLGDHPS